jgi:predicted RNase H-like nuclease
VSGVVVGVDGCRAGWVVATPCDGAHVAESLTTIVAGNLDLAAIDMPIGLPDTWDRAADRAARAYIRPRGACVFPSPPRPLVAFETYVEANAESKRRFGKGLTRQTFNLFEKIRDVDGAVDRDSQWRVIESHPECSFRALTGRVLAPKRTSAGRAARQESLEAVFGPIDTRLRGAQPDDVLDAYAVLWTALRHQRGASIVFGGDELDGRGLVMRIVA